ncbi:MAG: PqqD family protein [Erysipelotrichaceae bacterium]|nr:PqqD family protein [Erysipelotrichaceae bacterium]
MKVRKGFSICSIGEENIVVSDGMDDTAFNGMIRLNETGTYFWSLLENETTIEEMVEATLAEYDISKEMAQVEIVRFVDVLNRAGLLEK